MSISYLLDGLNPPQRAAVEHRGGPLLVLAGAGSGKTRVITVRIAHLVDEGVDPEHVLALTFTNKAAGEMAERVASLVGEEAAKALTVGTFHSLGLRMLEQEAKRLGLSRPITLLDAADQAVAVRQCLKALGIDPRRHDPRGFLTGISAARNDGLTPDDLRQRPGNKYTAQVYAAYMEWLEAHGAVDFDDLILKPVQLLRESEEARRKWRHKYRTILVDEYQDTNLTQLELVRLLADEHRSLCVVGDDDQSIYGWRGARIDNILQFEAHFTDARTIALEQNYRSTSHILEAANAVIARNSSRKVKRLWTDVGRGDPVRVVACKDPEAEATFVAGEIHRRHKQEGLDWKDCGILFRAGAQARPLEDALRLAGIPYRLVGAYDFYNRKEIKDVLSYLRVVLKPQDTAAWIRIANFPQRGLGPKTLSALRAFAKAQHTSLHMAAARAGEVGGITRPQVAALARLHDVIEGARVLDAEGQGRDLAGLVAWLCEETGARAAWIRDPTEGPGGYARWRSVEQLMETMKRWQRRKPRAGLQDFLQQITLDAREDGRDDADADKVSLMTIHSAKGLEWPVCFVIGCQEGYMPHHRVVEEGGDVSEERRLFYVAITRARRHIFLSYARTRKTFQGSEPSRPSRFLAEIPEDLVDKVERTRGGGEVEKTETRSRFADLLSGLGGRPGPGGRGRR